MASSSTCSQTHSSSASELSFGGGEAAAKQQYDAKGGEEESLYEALLRYHQEMGSDNGDFDDDNSGSGDDRYRRGRRQQHQKVRYTSGLNAAASQEDYLRQQIWERQQREYHFEGQQSKSVGDDMDRKIPARRTVSNDGPKPSTTRTATTTPPSTHSIEGDRRRRPTSYSESNTPMPVSSSSVGRSRSPRPEVKMLTPSKVKKPGIFQVNEPAIRANSAMYVDAYGDVDDGRSNAPPPQPQQQPQRSSDITTTDADVASVVSVSYAEHLSLPEWQETQQVHVLPVHRSGQSLQADQYRMEQLRTANPSLMAPSLSMPMGRTTERPVGSHNSIRSAPPQLVTAKNPGEVRLSDSTKTEPSTTTTIRSRNRPIDPPVSSTNVDPVVRGRQTSSQQLLYGPNRNLKPPPASSPQVGRIDAPGPINLMDLGSDEHIRYSSQLERQRSGHRGHSPAPSVLSSMSSPNPITAVTSLPSSRRSSDHSVHSIGSNHSGNLKPPPPTATDGTPSTARRTSQKAPPSDVILSHQKSSHTSEELKLRDDELAALYRGTRGNLYPKTIDAKPTEFLSPTSESLSTRNLSDPNLALERSIMSDIESGVRHQRSGSLDFDSSCGNDLDGRQSSKTFEDDLELALKLSLQEAKSTGNPSIDNTPAYSSMGSTAHGLPYSHLLEGGESAARHSSGRRARNPYLQTSSSAAGRGGTHSTETSRLEKDSFEMTKGDNDSSMDDLMMALKISAEESQLAQAKSSQSGGHRHPVASMDPPGKSIQSSDASEQYRILQRIREEQEQKDLELALKVSREETERDVRNRRFEGAGAVSSGDGVRMNDLTGGDPTKDFLISQKKALEEYQRNRKAAGHVDESAREQRRDQYRPSAIDDHRDNLLVQGAIETQRAITSGQAHTVRCRKCGVRLQAPKSYSLVYCPNCDTVSPA